MSILNTLSESPHQFLQPSPLISSSAILLAKSLLDPLAVEISDTQTLRRDENRKKRKRGEDTPAEQILQLRNVYTNGLSVNQIWEQAKRIIDATCNEVERSVQPRTQEEKASTNGMQPEASDVDEDESDNEGLDELDYDNLEKIEGESVDGDQILQDESESTQEDLHEQSVDAEEASEEDFSGPSSARQDVYIPDVHGLNDGFFSIDEFNRQSQFLEQMDARGDDENPSDEDEIDWDADPATMPSIISNDDDQKEGFDGDGTDSEEGTGEKGPTFGNADVNASESEDNAEEEGYLDGGMQGLGNTNDIGYADFFEPPPRKPSKSKRMRALPKTQPPNQHPDSDTREDAEDDMDADIQRAMNDVNRDIFASDSDLSGSEANSDTNTSRTKNMSTHEKQRAKIASEIRRLEAANVAKRDWTLSGEARAADRPLNSLIEEDLEFERVGKPVPVITAEVSEEIEQLIKRRILAREFDEVIRRRPDAIGNAADVRRGRAEVDDSKPQSGLAEIYEQDHLRANDPGYVDQRSAATKKQHQEIDRVWKEVSYQLDILSNLHFKPKRLNADVKTVEDKAKISMEDARPAGEGIGADESMLAPQEIYRAGEAKKDGEVVRRSGMSTNKEEMSREEKLRRRRREKERMKKGKSNSGPVKKDGVVEKKGKKEEKQGILDELRKGNVKVIDKKGELQNLGREKGQTSQVSSSALKL